MSAITTIAAIRRDDEMLSQIGAGIQPEGELSTTLWAWRQCIKSYPFPRIWRQVR